MAEFCVSSWTSQLLLTILLVSILTPTTHIQAASPRRLLQDAGDVDVLEGIQLERKSAAPILSIKGRAPDGCFGGVRVDLPTYATELYAAGFGFPSTEWSNSRRPNRRIVLGLGHINPVNKQCEYVMRTQVSNHNYKANRVWFFVRGSCVYFVKTKEGNWISGVRCCGRITGGLELISVRRWQDEQCLLGDAEHQARCSNDICDV